MNLNYILTNLKKLSRAVNKIILTLLAAAFIGCGEETRRTDYIARVNDSYLTEQDLEKIISSNPGRNFYRNEIIRNWINREILFQKAVDEGILKDTEYKRILEDSRKELAASMILEQIYQKIEIKIEDDEISEYFNVHKEEFRLTEDHYLINKAVFKTEDYAVNFRDLLMESNWDTAVEDLNENYPIEQNKTSVFIAESELHPVALLRIARELYAGEISIVINEAPEQFEIIQMLEKHPGGTIPPQVVINENIKHRMIKQKKDEQVKNYIRDLYSDSQIEIRQEKK
jgi:hypothetical protein